MSSTLSPTMTAQLVDQGDLPEPDTGLVYLGGGRFYDPALGRALQPDPLGGVPIVPQSLSRYGVSALGPVGVAEAVIGQRGCLAQPLCGTPLNKTSGLAAADLTRGLLNVTGLSRLGQPHYLRSWFYSISVLDVEGAIEAGALPERRILGYSFIKTGLARDGLLTTQTYRNLSREGLNSLRVLTIDGNKIAFDAQGRGYIGVEVGPSADRGLTSTSTAASWQ